MKILYAMLFFGLPLVIDHFMFKDSHEDFLSRWFGGFAVMLALAVVVFLFVVGWIGLEAVL